MNMMLRTASALVMVLVAAGAPAHAQDNTIRVIHEDGHVDEVEAPGFGRPAAPSADQAAPAEAAPPQESGGTIDDDMARAVRDLRENGPAAVPVVPAVQTPAEAAPDSDKAVDSDAAKDQAGEEVRKGAATGADASGASAKPAKKDNKKTAKKDKAKKGKKDKKGQKKKASSSQAVKLPEAPPAYDIPPGTEITPEIAKMVALDYAPPARSVEILPRTHKGRDVYVVRFRTDDGFVDVLVDAKTGRRVTE
jgi:hypothetical protein